MQKHDGRTLSIFGHDFAHFTKDCKKRTALYVLSDKQQKNDYIQHFFFTIGHTKTQYIYSSETKV